MLGLIRGMAGSSVLGLLCVAIFAVAIYISGKPKIFEALAGSSSSHSRYFSRHFQKRRLQATRIWTHSTAEAFMDWSLSNGEFGDIAPQKARIVFYIMVAGWKEFEGLDAILETLYHVDHFFLLHVDAKAAPEARDHVKRRVAQIMEQKGRGRKNIRLVEPAMPIAWGGFTMTLNAIYGITQALHWTNKWEYFINLSASDFPLITTDEMADILGEHKGTNTSFIHGFLYQPSWEGHKYVDRREMFAEDRTLHLLDKDSGKVWPWAVLDSNKRMLLRPVPENFKVYKGEFWVMLHRSMAEYVHKSPDNQARLLLTYFSSMMVSDEEYFQTVACNPHFPSKVMHIHNDNLRFVNWWGGASPSVISPDRAVTAANSGAMFGRKFSTKTSQGMAGLKWTKDYLADGSRKSARMARVRRRLSERMGPAGEPQGFCNLKKEVRPAEPYFAIEGEEEKLPQDEEEAR